MKRLILIGGGHSHVEVLRRFAIDPPPDVELTLINPGEEAAYSGMLPGWIAGHYSRAQCHIDLAALSRQARCNLVLTRCNGMHLDAGLVFCEDGRALHFDVVSVDTGGRPAVFDIPGAFAHALPVKPVETFIARWEALCASASRGEGPERIVVAGAGAAGVEVLLAMQYRLAQSAPNHRARFVLVGDAPEILPAHNTTVRRMFDRILRQRGVAIETGCKVEQVESGLLRIRGDRTIAADLIVWATGASAPLWPRSSDLAIDDRGFILVNDCLQSTSHPQVFAAGDIATVRDHPRPKSGVYAVRAGPPLAENLRRTLLSQPFRHWIPQPESLALISTGDRHAIASRGNFAVQGNWVWRWKDWIDRRFMERYAGGGKR